MMPEEKCSFSRLFEFTCKILTNVFEMKKNVKVKYPIFIFTDVAFFTGVQSRSEVETDVSQVQ